MLPAPSKGTPAVDGQGGERLGGHGLGKGRKCHRQPCSPRWGRGSGGLWGDEEEGPKRRTGRGRTERGRQMWEGCVQGRQAASQTQGSGGGVSGLPGAPWSSGPATLPHGRPPGLRTHGHLWLGRGGEAAGSEPLLATSAAMDTLPWSLGESGGRGVRGPGSRPKPPPTGSVTFGPVLSLLLTATCQVPLWRGGAAGGGAAARPACPSCPQPPLLSDTPTPSRPVLSESLRPCSRPTHVFVGLRPPLLAQHPGWGHPCPHPVAELLLHPPPDAGCVLTLLRELGVFSFY